MKNLFGYLTSGLKNVCLRLIKAREKAKMVSRKILYFLGILKGKLRLWRSACLPFSHPFSIPFFIAREKAGKDKYHAKCTHSKNSKTTAGIKETPKEGFNYSKGYFRRIKESLNSIISSRFYPAFIY